MKQEEMQTLTNAIQEKLGDNSGIIADDLAKIISNNSQQNSEIENRDSRIKQLEKQNELLTTANGSLLQQIAMGEETPPHETQKNEETPKKKFDFKSVFDKKGRFTK